MSEKIRRDEQDNEAERYYERRHEDDDWDAPDALEKPARLDVTLSVRFTRDELDAVRGAAERAGLKPTAFIRHAAVEALVQTPVDRARLKRDLATALELMQDAQRTLAS